MRGLMIRSFINSIDLMANVIAISSYLNFWKERNEEEKCKKALEERKIRAFSLGQLIDTSKVYDEDMIKVYDILMGIVCGILGLENPGQYLDHSRFARRN